MTQEIKDQILSSARVLAIPMRIKFRGVTTREVVLFEGPNGWAEWSPFPEYPDEEAAIWLNAAIEWAFGDLPEPKLKTVKVNATLPAVDNIEEALAPFGKFEVVKIKVAEKGQNIEDDFRRITRTNQLYPEARIRLDANGAYTMDQALQMAHFLVDKELPIEYLEQPVKTIADMAELKLALAKFSELKIAADESVRKVSDPLAVAQANAADILVLKAAPLGGVTNSIRIAKEAGLPVVVSSALETSVGLSMGAYLASELGSPYASGLGTAALLADDVTNQPLNPLSGVLGVRRVDALMPLLEKLSMPENTKRYWIARLNTLLSSISTF
ncbi:MAG: o-succinylbenzoate synthase [Acidobacteria bacterium]|nr:o-succinylbenzoate synthase [Acidobacteriota bacterium]